MTDPLLPKVALYGAPGAGKTSGAQFLEDRFGYVRSSFAGYHRGGVRDIAVRLWGPGADKDRGKLQDLGEKLREVDPDVWIRTLLRADVVASRYPSVVDDLRTPREWDALAEHGFVFVEVRADAELRLARLRASGKLASGNLDRDIEHYLDERRGDHAVYNSGAPDEFREALADIINIERRRRA